MESLIDQKSDEYVSKRIKINGLNMNYSPHTRKCLASFDGFQLEQAYCDGAMFVIDEVLRTISVSEEGWLEKNLLKLIKQLKGNEND